MNEEARARLVITTVGSEADAARLSRTMVDRMVAACVTVIAPVRSVFRWHGEVVEEVEWLLLCKTTASGVAALREALLAAHPYEVPEVLVLDAGGLPEPYAAWLRESTSRGAAGAP